MDIIKVLKKQKNFDHLNGADPDSIKEVQKNLNVKFSDEYIKYISLLGVASFFGHELTGICTSSRLNVVDVTIEERKNNPQTPLNLYVVEQANIDGIVIWQSETGEIYQSHPNSIPIKICDSLAEYIEL